MWHACSLAAAITSRTDKAVKTVQVLLAEKEDGASCKGAQGCR